MNRRVAPLLVALGTAPLATAPTQAGEDDARVAATSSAAAGGVLRVLLFADTDDDDDDGVADRERTGRDATADIRWINASRARPIRLRRVEGDVVRVHAGDRTFDPGGAAPELSVERVGLQGLRPGRGRVDLGSHSVEAIVCELFALDAAGARVNLATSHASISRTLPTVYTGERTNPRDDDALRWVAACPRGTELDAVRVESWRPAISPAPSALGRAASRPPSSAARAALRDPASRLLDSIDEVPLDPVPCPEGLGAELECRATPLIRAASDAVDRNHPGASERSLRAEVGGKIVLSVEGRKATSIRVGGPRDTAIGPIGRLRGRLRFHVVRLSPGGAVPVGGNAAGALAVARAEARMASALWGQCGVHFGADDELEVHVVDPPPSYLLAVGCNLGLPASGGRIAFRAGDQIVRVPVPAEQTPTQIAGHIADALKQAGHSAEVSLNPRIGPGALRTADVLVRRSDGELAELAALGDEPLSTDATLGVCIGEVDFADGLDHFGDLDAVAGTVEERTLIKAFQDGDPSTIEIFVIPSFSKTGRIGESFIDADRSSIRNVVVVDRAGIRAGARSFALAHELGHILLDMSGHPDDYGVDRPWDLMDADAADPSIFGPRRLSVDDCVRAVLQSGPGAPIPLLEEWPLYTPRPGAPPE